jgi:Na+(H+)/acetate symporter ActP
MYGKWGTSKGAISSMLVGGGFTLWHYLITLGVKLPVLMPAWPGRNWPFTVFWSIVLGFVVYTVVSIATQTPEEKMKAETFMNSFAQK